jgi:serine/threonine protein kinase
MARRESLLPPGTAVGRYVIERLIGGGAMGDVYAARDTNLGRAVALKVLPRSSAGDPLRVRRFIREAQLASSLDHPAIVTVFDSGSIELGGRTVVFLAMELIDGPTLRDWARGVRDLSRIAGVLAEVAEGLARAHERGIVHRDLKPENVMILRGDHPKIVDFGVAKLTDRAGGASDASDTAPAAAVGTAAYMAPEQVSGAGVDGRADIFAFGCVMYEVLTGRSPFLRDSPVETMHAVLHDTPPPVREVKPAIPPEVERIVRRCLMVDREKRYQSIRDVALDLRELGVHAVPFASTPKVRSRYTAVAAGILTLIALGIWTNTRRDQLPDQAIAQATPAVPQPLMVRMTNSGNISGGAISPDGNVLAYITRDGESQSLWVKQIATGTSVRIVPPEPVYYGNVSISADGNYIYYGVSTRTESNIMDLMQVPLLGGQRRRIVHDLEGNFSVSPVAKRVAFDRFSALDRIYRLFVADIDSGEEQLVLTRRFPNMIGAMAWRPDGKRLTFVSSVLEKKFQNVLYDLDVGSRAIKRLPTPEWAWMGPFAWLPNGSGVLVTAAEPKLAPQIWFLDPRSGEGRKITSDISDYGFVSVTADSRSFVSIRSDISLNIWSTTLQRPNVSQAVTTGLGNRYGDGGVRWMPDGTIAFTSVWGGMPPTIFTVLPSGGQPRQMTHGMTVWNPVVSPDGKRLAFVSDKSGPSEVWTSAVDGSDAKQVTHCGAAVCPTWMKDSHSLVYASMAETQAAWRIGIDGGAPVRLTDRPANSTRVSPDGHWLLCRLRSTDGTSPLWRTALLPLDREGPPHYFGVPRSNGSPRAEWLPDSSGFAFVDFANGVGNLWLQPLDGRSPRQMTNFDSGEIGNYDIDRGGRIALSRLVRVNDLVLVRDFR